MLQTPALHLLCDALHLLLAPVLQTPALHLLYDALHLLLAPVLQTPALYLLYDALHLLLAPVLQTRAKKSFVLYEALNMLQMLFSNALESLLLF